MQALELGKETTAKVAEIVETGALARNKAVQADPVAQVILKVNLLQYLLRSAFSKLPADVCATALTGAGSELNYTNIKYFLQSLASKAYSARQICTTST